MLDPNLAKALAALLGAPVAAARPVAGGCIHRALKLQLADGRHLFAKLNHHHHLPLFEAEADGLAALAAMAGNGLRIPNPLHWGALNGQSILLLDWLELEDPPASATAWYALGASLAALHRGSLASGDGRFGWSRDNFIGASPQPNGWSDAWGPFFTDRRLGEQLRRAADQGHGLEGSQQLLGLVARWLSGHQPPACLVHGDLWRGNAGLLNQGQGSLFDPAVHRADREVDLAMAHLFGGFPAAFFAGYGDSWPLPPGHQKRRDLYNLYHLLNHANLFGGSYWRQAQVSIQALLRNPPIGP